MTETQRLYYLDNLKVLLIGLVIMHHVGQAYGATGGSWAYAYPGDRVKELSHLFRFDAAFFMGLFFFISGYFLPRSYDRHGARKFITDKLIRFGILVVFGTLVMMPVMEYVKYLHYTGHIAFGDFYVRHWFGYAPDAAVPGRVFNIAHLWFIEHLLIYSLLYAAVRTLLQEQAPSFCGRHVAVDTRIVPCVDPVAAHPGDEADPVNETPTAGALKCCRIYLPRKGAGND